MCCLFWFVMVNISFDVVVIFVVFDVLTIVASHVHVAPGFHAATSFRIAVGSIAVAATHELAMTARDELAQVVAGRHA